MALISSSTPLPAFGHPLAGYLRRIADFVTAFDDAPAQAEPISEPTPTQFELRPGVVIDAAAGTAYVMNPHRGIDAIDLSNGHVLWSTTVAAKPLALFDDRLVAQAELVGSAHVMTIVLLETKNGIKVPPSATLATPDAVWPSIDDGMGTSFKVTSHVVGEELLVSWSATRRTISGIVPPGPPPEEKYTGAASIDLKTGRGESLSPDQAATRIRAAEPATVRPRVDALSSPESPPQLAGEVYFATDAPASTTHPELRRWKAATGEQLPDVAISPGFVAATPSANGASLATATAIGAGSTGLQDYEWSIYSLKNGDRIGQVRMFPSSAPFFLWRSVLIYVSPRFFRRVGGAMRDEPLALRALDLKTGTELWKRPIRETVYRGLMPPMP